MTEKPLTLSVSDVSLYHAMTTLSPAVVEPAGVCQFAAVVLVEVNTCPAMDGAVTLIVTP